MLKMVKAEVLCLVNVKGCLDKESNENATKIATNYMKKQLSLKNISAPRSGRPSILSPSIVKSFVVCKANDEYKDNESVMKDFDNAGIKLLESNNEAVPAAAE